MLNLLKSLRFRHHNLASFKNGPKSTAEFSPALWFEECSLPACLSSFSTATIARKKSDIPPFQIPPAPKCLMFKCFQEGIPCTRQPATKEATEAWPNMVWRSIWKLGACHPTQISQFAEPSPFPSRCNPGPGDQDQHVPVGLLQFTLWLSPYFPTATLIDIR